MTLHDCNHFVNNHKYNGTIFKYQMQENLFANMASMQEMEIAISWLFNDKINKVIEIFKVLTWKILIEM